jgi:hypothetical protein
MSARPTLTERLRPHLQGFPPDKAEQFLSAVAMILRLRRGLAGEQSLTDVQRRKQLQRLAGAAESFIELLEAVPASLLARPSAGMLGTLTRLADAESSDQESDQSDEATMGEQQRRVRFERWQQRRHACEDREVYPAAKRWRDDPHQAAHDLHQAWIETHGAAAVLLRELQDATEQALPTRSGPRPADGDGTLTEIANTYLRVFGEMPTTTNPGTFRALAEEITGDREPGRAVRVAVAALKKVTNSAR